MRISPGSFPSGRSTTSFFGRRAPGGGWPDPGYVACGSGPEPAAPPAEDASRSRHARADAEWRGRKKSPVRPPAYHGTLNGDVILCGVDAHLALATATGYRRRDKG